MDVNHYEIVRQEILNGGPITAFNWSQLSYNDQRSASLLMVDRGLTIDRDDGGRIYLKPAPVNLSPSNPVDSIGRSDVGGFGTPSGPPKTWAAMNAEFQFIVERMLRDEISERQYTLDITRLVSNFLTANDALDPLIKGGLAKHPELR